MDTLLVQTIDKDIREWLRRAMRACPKGRDTIAEELSRRVGRTVSSESLHKWSSEAEGQRRLPADCVLPLSEILDDDSLQRLVLSPRMTECLRLGEWVLSSKWVIEKLDIKLPEQCRKNRNAKSLKSGRSAAPAASRP